MARRYETIEMSAHRAIIGQQVIYEERNQQEVQHRSRDIDEAEETFLQPLAGHSENAIEEVAGIGDLRLQKLVQRQVYPLYLGKYRVNTRLVFDERARLVVGFYQLPPEPGQYEDQN